MKQYRKIQEVIDLLSPAQLAAVADIYEDGEGVEDNSKIAIQYYRMAAEAGDSYAQSTLANAYTIGRDVQQSDEFALLWYKKAAEQGNPYAQYEVAMRTPDNEGALLWLHLSANQGFPTAMKELSDRLREIDPKLSRLWLKKYYRKRKRCKIENVNGKKYMRSLRRETLPKVVDGEVVILI